MTKLDKEDVKYSRGMIHSHCGKVFVNDKGYCKHFIEVAHKGETGRCHLVEGSINPVYWCTEFEKAKK